jgi:hypothetical protein
LEHEEEYIVNKLQKQLLEAKCSKDALQEKLNQEREAIVKTLSEILVKIGTKNDDLTKELEIQISTLSQQQDSLTKDTREYSEKNSQLRDDLYKVQADSFLLEQKLRREVHRRENLNKELIDSETSKEFIQESMFNQVERKKPHEFSPRRSPINDSNSDSEITPGKRTPQLKKTD